MSTSNPNMGGMDPLQFIQYLLQRGMFEGVGGQESAALQAEQRAEEGGFDEMSQARFLLGLLGRQLPSLPQDMQSDARDTLKRLIQSVTSQTNSIRNTANRNVPNVSPILMAAVKQFLKMPGVMRGLSNSVTPMIFDPKVIQQIIQGQTQPST